MHPHTHPTETPIFPLAETRQIDEAIDYAARQQRAIVSEFLAAPASDNSHIDIAIEFFVPPASLDDFTRELDRALVRRTLGYSTARRASQVLPLRVVVLPAGAFHQWRVAWNIATSRQHERRWSPQRDLIEALLRQGETGFREFQAMA